MQEAYPAGQLEPNHPMQEVLDIGIAWDANKAMNALDCFLTDAKLSNAEFAAMVESSESSISRLRRGLQSPSFDLLTRIAAATSGKVTPNDFLPDADIHRTTVPEDATPSADPFPAGPASTDLIISAVNELDAKRQRIADSETARADRAEQVVETVRAAVGAKGRAS